MPKAPKPTLSQATPATKAGRAARKAVSAPTAATAGKRGTAAPTAKVGARGPRVAKTAGRQTKQDLLVKMLRRGRVSIEEMAAATGWQQHSVRGVLTATIKGRLKLPLVSEKDAKGTRRYSIELATPK